MPVFEPFWKTNPIEYIVHATFPTLTEYSRMRTANEFVFVDDDYVATHEGAEALRKELQEAEPASISARVSELRENEAERHLAAEQAVEKIRTYGKPYANADFEHWAKLSFWSVDEAAALFVGKNPATVTPQSLEKFRSSPLPRRYFLCREIISRALQMGQLNEATPPFEYLQWSRRMAVDFPSELAIWVETVGEQILDWKTLYLEMKTLAEDARRKTDAAQAAQLASLREHSDYLDQLREQRREVEIQRDALIEAKDKRISALSEMLSSRDAKVLRVELGTRERDTLLRMIIGLAVKGYGYDPKAARSTIVPDIVSDLELAGVPVGDDTVRKYLREAAEYLPRDD
jgi:hypothetical protein